jgi:hypothetical protein
VTTAPETTAAPPRSDFGGAVRVEAGYQNFIFLIVFFVPL